MAIIITFSGLVGTGKSVCARFVSSELHRRGVPVYYLRYRFISLKSFFAPPKQITRFEFRETPAKPPPKTADRFAKFSLHSPARLLLTAPWYLLRAYLFLILVNVRYPKAVVVVDRYVYDHLVHYRLTEERFAWIFRWLGKFLPKPHLPFVLFADLPAVKQARPAYSTEYIELNLENYRKLPILFPEVIWIDPQSIREKANLVLSKVEDYLGKN